MGTNTLAENLYAVLSSLPSPGEKDHPLHAARMFPLVSGDGLTEFESECRDWGFVFGLAYGMARGEDPYESTGSVTGRAMSAAVTAWKNWDGDRIFQLAWFEAVRADAAEAVA